MMASVYASGTSGGGGVVQGGLQLPDIAAIVTGCAQPARTALSLTLYGLHRRSHSAPFCSCLHLCPCRCLSAVGGLFTVICYGLSSPVLCASSQGSQTSSQLTCHTLFHFAASFPSTRSPTRLLMVYLSIADITQAVFFMTPFISNCDIQTGTSLPREPCN